MYKIYINETLIILCATSDINHLRKAMPAALFAQYTGKTKHILTYIDMLEKSENFSHDALVFHFSNFPKLKEDFKSLFVTINAAGGLVVNDKKEILCIHKRGKWDLPKGKIDIGETKEDAAVREVKEETGINNLTIRRYIGKTKHIFTTKSGKRAIKKSYWYHMLSDDTDTTPQAEEDIDSVEWKNPITLLGNRGQFYSNLEEVVKAYLSYEL